MNRSIGLFGTAEIPADDRLVTCGRLSLRIRGSELRRVSFDGAEAVRSIAFVIRDRDWGTLALSTTSANLDTRADSFRYDYSAKADGAPVTVSITVTGSGDGQMSVEGEAQVDGEFETNRTGFVILHPIEGVAGAPADVVGSDGAPRHGSFPERISPGQPFFDIQEIRHEFAGGGTVHIRFEGEIFEMEDQRNCAPVRVAALAYASDRRTIVWLANLAAEPETVAIDGASGACAKLELEHLEDAAAAPDWFETALETKLEGQLELGAYGVARLRLAR